MASLLDMSAIVGRLRELGHHVDEATVESLLQSMSLLGPSPEGTAKEADKSRASNWSITSEEFGDLLNRSTDSDGSRQVNKRPSLLGLPGESGGSGSNLRTITRSPEMVFVFGTESRCLISILRSSLLHRGKRRHSRRYLDSSRELDEPENELQEKDSMAPFPGSSASRVIALADQNSPVHALLDRLAAQVGHPPPEPQRLRYREHCFSSPAPLLSQEENEEMLRTPAGYRLPVEAPSPSATLPPTSTRLFQSPLSAHKRPSTSGLKGKAQRVPMAAVGSETPAAALHHHRPVTPLLDTPLRAHVATAGRPQSMRRPATAYVPPPSPLAPPKTDRVARYKQLSSGWQRNRLAKGETTRTENFHLKFRAMHALETYRLRRGLGAGVQPDS